MSIRCDILVSVEKIFSASIPGGMAELVDAADLKSVEGNTSWEFKSPYPHWSQLKLQEQFVARQYLGSVGKIDNGIVSVNAYGV